MDDWEFWALFLSPLGWLYVAWDVNRPRYYGDDGKIYRTAREAAEAKHE